MQWLDNEKMEVEENIKSIRVVPFDIYRLNRLNRLM